MILAFGIKTCGDEVGDDLLVIGTGLKQVVVGVDVVAFTLDFIEELVQRGVVFISDEIGLRNHCGAILKIYEAVGAFKVKLDLLRIEEVKNGNVVLSKTKVLQGVSQFFGISE